MLQALRVTVRVQQRTGSSREKVTRKVSEDEQETPNDKTAPKRTLKKVVNESEIHNQARLDDG